MLHLEFPRPPPAPFRVNESSFSALGPVTFHKYHGRNIILYENDTVAFRRSGYAHGITFSKKPLQPGEIFLFEIEKFEHGWLGNLRCGLTQQDPSRNFGHAQYAFPGLVDREQSWILPISTTDISTYGHAQLNTLYPAIHESHDLLHTIKGSIPVSVLQPTCQKPVKRARIEENLPLNLERAITYYAEAHARDEDRQYNHPTDVGSRIGVTYVTRDNVAEMYMLLNGDLFGPCATGIPYKRSPIYAVIDLYGTTKQVRIVQTFGVPSLKMACREKILQQVTHSKLYRLPLPQRLIQYLNYR